MFCGINCGYIEVSTRSKVCCGQNPMCSGSSLSQSIHEQTLIEAWTVRSEIFHDRAFIQTSDDSLLLFLSCPSGPLLPCSLLAASHKHTYIYTQLASDVLHAMFSVMSRTFILFHSVWKKTTTTTTVATIACICKGVVSLILCLFKR